MHDNWRFSGSERKSDNMASKASGTKLAEHLVDGSGPFLTGEALWKSLGFPKERGRLGVRVFKLPDRSGTFAFTQDVAEWLRAIDKEKIM